MRWMVCLLFCLLIPVSYAGGDIDRGWVQRFGDNRWAPRGDLAAIDLTDPGADRITFWDESANSLEWLVPGTGLSISGTTINVALTPFTTTNLSEGSNLYYTTARFDERLATKTTADLTEGANLYYTDERAHDYVGGTLTDTASVDLTFDDGANTISAVVLPAGIDHGSLGGLADDDHTQYHTDERGDDRAAALIQNGTGITWSYNDGANTLTPSVSITQYTDELAQDAIGSAASIDTDTINFTYTDGTPELKWDVRTQMSLTSDASGIKLSGDATTPGNSKYYGTDSGGTKGFHALPTSSLSDGDYGDITVGGTGTTMTIDAGSVTYAKMQDVSATDKVLGRSTAGSGDVEEIACTSTCRAIMDDSTPAAVRSTISAGYVLTVAAANEATLNDGNTLYWSGLAGDDPTTTEADVKYYIPRTGTVKAIYVWAFCGTGGTNEAWLAAFRLNATTDTTIENLSSAAGYRLWDNAALSIAVTAGDTFNIKMTNPTWATNPANCVFNGAVYIE